MEDLINWIKDLFKALLNLMVSNLWGIVRELAGARGNISSKFLLRDIFIVVARTGMMLVFQALTFLIFIVLPQGQDIVMVAVDDVKQNGHYGNILGLVLGTIAWSIFSEFAVRYSIYVSDNSGNSLSEQRVIWRKAVQQAVADVFLLLPYVIVIFSLWANYRRLPAADQHDYEYSFLKAGVVLYIAMIVISQIYFAGRNAEARKKSRQARYGGNKLLDRLDTWCCRIYKAWFPQKEERAWLGKLQGMYNDYVFRINKPTQFAGKSEEDAWKLANNFVYASDPERNYFPKSRNMSEEGRVPAAFRLRAFAADGMDLSDPHVTTGNEGGYFRWQYHIPLSFYKRSHKWLAGFIAASVIWLLIVLFVNVKFYDCIGSPALVLGAFCSWTGVYMAILFIDFGLLRRGAPVRPATTERPAKYPRGWRGGRGLVDWLARNVSFRTFMLIWLLLASYYNEDHLVRYAGCPSPCENCETVKEADVNNGLHPKDGYFCDTRPAMRTHFTRWLTNYVADSANLYYELQPDGSYQAVWPVIFVCAEGGAMRTGAFTSMMLGELQDSLPRLQGTGFDFRKSIYACSGVSGGSVGLAAFNAFAYMDNGIVAKTGMKQINHTFFARDYLSAVVGKLFYGDILQLWWPWHKNSLDRMVGLEESLEKGYVETIHENTWSQNIFRLYPNDHSYPAFFINTTEVETGLQCWMSNVRADSSMFDYSKRDLLGWRLQRGVRLVTAVNFSTRFPLFAPAASVVQGGGQKYHYVDGGYVENTGASTMLEILQAVRPVMDSFENKDTTTGKITRTIKPYVVMLRFDQPEDAVQDINFANEITEILYGIYNTRAGRLVTAQWAIKKYVEDSALGGKVIQLQLKPDGHQVPMSWAFSSISMEHLSDFVDSLWYQRHSDSLKSLPFVDTARFKCALTRPVYK